MLKFSLAIHGITFWIESFSYIFILHLQDVMQQATNAILRGGTIMTPSVSAKTIAEQLAEKINAKLNYTPVEKLEEERQAAEQAETVKRYEEELEINDFPQVCSTLATSSLTYWTDLGLIYLLVWEHLSARHFWLQQPFA